MSGILDALDASVGPVDESDLPNRIQATGAPEPGDAAEWLAFMFREGGASPWGTHFCPLATGTKDDGSLWTVPAIDPVTPEVVAYWSGRALAVQHPVLTARYAGLVWDFHRKLTGVRPSVDFARLRIDAAVRIAAAHLHEHPLLTWAVLEHALGLALELNDRGRVATVVDACLAFDESMDERPGTWRAFGLLYGRPKPKLTDQQEQRLVAALERRLAHHANPPSGQPDPWTTEVAAVRLARHYRRRERPEDVERVLVEVERAFAPLVAKADAIRSQSWLRGVHDHYAEFGLRQHAERVRKEIHALGPGVRKGLREVTTTMEIPRSEMDRFVDEMLGAAPLDALQRVVLRFVPSRQGASARVREESEAAPLLSLLRHELVDHEGRHIASVGPLRDDEDGRIVQAIYQEMVDQAPFLRAVLGQAQQRGVVGVETLLEIASGSPCFEEDKRGILARGIDAAFSGDHLVATHLIVPQVEAAIRQLARQLGVGVLRPNRAGGMDLRVLDDLLREQALAEALSEDVVLYLRVLLTDRRGVNIRNTVCHGMAPDGAFHQVRTDRLLHVLLFLAMIRLGEPDSGTGEP